MSADQDDWDSHWATFGDSTEGHAANRYRARLITMLLGDVNPSSTIIDIGSGQGELALVLKSKFQQAKVIGLENSKTGVERATQMARERGLEARFVQRDLLENAEVDQDLQHVGTVAICTEVLEHLDSPDVLLTNALAYLAPNCRVVITVPGGPRSAFERHIGHRRHYDARSLRALLELSGYRVERVVQAGFPFFNLYRLASVIRGERLIKDLDRAATVGSPSKIMTLALRGFDRAFQWNFASTPFGWQLAAVATVR